MRNSLVVAALATVILFCGAFAQPPEPKGKPTESETKVFVGQPIADAKKALTSRNIDFGKGPMAVAASDPDLDYISVVVDKNHTMVLISYSKSKSQVTYLSMIFRPHLQSPRVEHTWLPASQLVLKADRSYSVEFKAPPTDEELKKNEENRPPPQYPPSIPNNKK